MFMRVSLTLKERYKSKYSRTRDTLLIDRVYSNSIELLQTETRLTVAYHNGP